VARARENVHYCHGVSHIAWAVGCVRRAAVANELKAYAMKLYNVAAE